MSDLYFPNASTKLAKLLDVVGKEAEIDAFLARFGVRAVQGFISFMPASWSSEEVLESMKDTHRVGEIMEYALTDEDEEDDEQT